MSAADYLTPEDADRLSAQADYVAFEDQATANMNHLMEHSVAGAQAALSGDRQASLDQAQYCARIVANLDRQMLEAVAVWVAGQLALQAQHTATEHGCRHFGG